MSKVKDELKADIEKIDDEQVIEKIQLYIMGIMAQKKIEEQGGACDVESD